MATAAQGSSDSEGRLRIRTGRLSFFLGIAIFAGKLGAYALTGSTAVFSDAMESVVNVAASGLLLFSLIVAARPADRDHPYGHGKVEFFSAGVEGALIAVASALILTHAVRELIQGPEMQRLGFGAVLIGGLALANGLLGAHLIRVGRRTGSFALEADGQHLMTDVLTSAGVVVGLVAVRLTGWLFIDPLIAIAVALNILSTGWSLLRRSIGGLMDEADIASLERMVEIFECDREPWFIDIHSLRSWRSGATQHVDLHMVVPRYLDADRLHEIADHTNEMLPAALGRPGEVIVHFDPCRPRQCPGCVMVDCPVRSVPLEKRERFSLEDATRIDEVLDTGAPVPGTGL